MTNQDDITPQDMDHVRRSFQRCKAHPEFSDIFYDNLALQSSEIGPMFAATDMVKQNQLLQVGIAQLIDFADGQPSAAAEIGRLAVIHDRSHYATRPDLYPLWVNALLITIDETDSDVTSDLLASWRRVVAPGIALMSAAY